MFWNKAAKIEELTGQVAVHQNNEQVLSAKIGNLEVECKALAEIKDKSLESFGDVSRELQDVKERLASAVLDAELYKNDLFRTVKERDDLQYRLELLQDVMGQLRIPVKLVKKK